MSYRGLFCFLRYVPSKPHTVYHILSDISTGNLLDVRSCFAAFSCFLPDCCRKFEFALLIRTTKALRFMPRLRLALTKCFWSSLRPISSSQLHTLLCFHPCPIYLVVFKGSYCFRMGYLILRGASRLDAFSVYPCPTWLPGHATGVTTGAPEVSPTRSSRTKVSSSQISCAHAG